MTSRELVLQRLRQRRSQRPAPPRDFSPMQRPGWTMEEKLDRFRVAMEGVHGEVHNCRGADWVSVLAALLEARQVNTLLVGNSPEPLAALSSSSASLPELVVYDEPVAHWQDYLFSHIDAGLTTTRGGIAETGSLILWPDPTEPRLLSLAPPVHIALLKTTELYTTFAEAIRAQGWGAAMPANALLVSGPSKTADIEQTLAYGVHGPRELLVLVIS